MAGTIKVISPVAFLTNAAATIYTPPAATIYVVLKHIHICNITASAATFTLYIGLTGGSVTSTTLFAALSVAANSSFDYYLNRKMLSTEFLSGLASGSSTLTIEVTGEHVIV